MSQGTVSFDQPRRDAEEKYAPAVILGAVLGHEHVGGRLHRGVGSRARNVMLLDDIIVRVARGESKDFLDVTLEDERHVEVEDVHVSKDVYLEHAGEGLCQPLGILAPDESFT